LDKNVMVPWFTSDTTVPDTAPVRIPAVAPPGTVKVSVSMAANVPVTDAAEVEPLMPVAAMLTKPGVAEFTEGVLNRGADADTYASTVLSY
jgi:hypothetical protein